MRNDHFQFEPESLQSFELNTIDLVPSLIQFFRHSVHFTDRIFNIFLCICHLPHVIQQRSSFPPLCWCEFEVEVKVDVFISL